MKIAEGERDKAVQKKDYSYAELAAELTGRNIRASFQRVKILQFLLQNRIHPTVDQIYKALHPEIPTLSRTTVYNTLTAFLEVNLVRILSIEDDEKRYDITIEDHGHFKCQTCGRIYNFAVDMDRLIADDLSRFQILDRNVYFKGICPECVRPAQQKA